MEELTIEEKAELYDKAIERANSYLGVNQLGDIWIYELLPELEKDDERIRKALLKSFKEYLKQNEATWGKDIKFKYVKAKDVITYLEKQGENISPLKFTFDDVLALQLAMAAVKNEQKDKDLYEQLKSLHDRVHDAYWLEKKPTNLVAILKNYFADTPKEQQEKDWDELKHLNDIGLDAKIVLGAYEPMSLDEAIEHCKEKSCGNNACALEHKQLEKWLTELKELKEKKPWSDEDENYFNAIISVIKKNRSLLKLDDWDITWLRFLKYRVQVQQQWSEEDKMQLDAAIHLVSSTGHIETANWLKDLKNRVQPQLQQGWSEEDEIMINFALTYFRTRGALEDSNIIKWLKSLKNRMQLHGGECYNPYKEVVESIAEMCQHYDRLDLGSLQDFYDNVKVKCKDAKEYDSLNS